MAEHTKQRIVVKVGTSTLTHDSGALDLRSMEHLVRTLADLHGMGHEVILVTSGAIAVGTAKLGLSERPKELRMTAHTDVTAKVLYRNIRNFHGVTHFFYSFSQNRR